MAIPQNDDKIKADNDAAFKVFWSEVGDAGRVDFSVALPRSQPGRSRGGRSTPCSPERAHTGKLLKFIKLLPWGARLSGAPRAEGTLAFGTFLIAKLADDEKRPRDPGEMRKWARGVKGATAKAIEDYVAAACAKPIPAGLKPWELSRMAGNTVELTKTEWIARGAPRMIFPFDIPDDFEVLAVLTKKRRTLGRVRSARHRRRNGAKPRDQSKAAWCRAHGISVRTLDNHIREGNAVAWLKAKGIRKWPGFVTRPSIKNGSVTKAGHDGPAPSGAPAFTGSELSHMAEAVEIGLSQAENAVAMPTRKAALARLFEIAAKAFAPKPANHPEKDENPMISDGRASSADAYRPLTVPGDMPPDEPNVIVPAIPADDDAPLPVAAAIDARVPDGPGRIDADDVPAWLKEEAEARRKRHAAMAAGPADTAAGDALQAESRTGPGDTAYPRTGAPQGGSIGRAVSSTRDSAGGHHDVDGIGPAAAPGRLRPPGAQAPRAVEGGRRHAAARRAAATLGRSRDAASR